MPIAVRAGDGMSEINQVSISGSGGLPFTISTSGSYIRTSNLVLSSTEPAALQITAPDVYLDLNGFSIIGPESCSSMPEIAGVVSEVLATQRGVTVVNETIQGCGRSGLDLGEKARVAHVRVRCAGHIGIAVGGASRVERSAVSLSDVPERGPYT